jgi:outer membrane lipoprotein-sorting protein
MHIKKVLVTLFAILTCHAVVAAAAAPEGWSEPTVAHEGIRVMSTGGRAVETRFRHLPPGKQREEMSHEGMSMTMIIRPDLGRVWTVLPGNMYMEMALDEAGQATPSADGVIDFEKLGEEQVNGWATTRYRVTTLEEGKRSEGYFWVTEHWIPVRMEIAASDNPREVMRMEVRDLQVQDQDPALFELPRGATKLPGFGGQGGFEFPGR